MPSQFAAPVLISPGQPDIRLERMPLKASSDETTTEDWLQDLLFRHPEALPIEEIDRAYLGLVPICRELSTPAGPIDVLYATPQGRLVVVEAKLWRNPEARRKVVGQILDYAKELSRWTYEDLQREVSRTTGVKGNVLFEMVARKHPELIEAAFVDEVSRGLRTGRFLLLICGDGIREGVAAIAEFLNPHGTLHFSLGVIEIAIYSLPDGGRLVQPRILANSVLFKRTTIFLRSDNFAIEEDEEDNNQKGEPSDLAVFYQEFWREFINELKLDEVGQPLPKTSANPNIFFMMPTASNTWITVFFSQPKQQCGVFFTGKRGQSNEFVFDQLREHKSAIEAELGFAPDCEQQLDKHRIITRKGFPNLRSPEHRAEIKAWLADMCNRFVNAFRPRVERIIEDA